MAQSLPQENLARTPESIDIQSGCMQVNIMQ
jgi:hypothetical protein